MESDRDADDEPALVEHGVLSPLSFGTFKGVGTLSSRFLVLKVSSRGLFRGKEQGLETTVEVVVLAAMAGLHNWSLFPHGF